MCWPKELCSWFSCKVDLGDGPSEQPFGTRTKEMYLPKKSDENQKVSKFNGYTSSRASHPVANSINNGSNIEHGDPKNNFPHEHPKFPGPNEGKLMPGVLALRGKNDFITPNHEKKSDEDKFYGPKAYASAEPLEVQSVGRCTEATEEADELLPKDKITNADHHAADRRDQAMTEKTTPRR